MAAQISEEIQPRSSALQPEKSSQMSEEIQLRSPALQPEKSSQIYNDTTVEGSARAHLGNNYNTLEARNLAGSSVAIQASQQIVYGVQNININEHAPQMHPSRCVSVPFTTVSTFTERPHLSQELDEKLGKTHSAGLAHAVTVVGLGGTGKTQLVLHYIEEHEAEYDTVLWLDVRSKETARSSYERCCRALGLPVECSTDDNPLHNLPPVQAVLLWLRVRATEKQWLAVVDNADDLSWNVSSIVPKGKAGTVIITSQDARASRLLGGRTSTLDIDSMSPEEAVNLMSSHLDMPDDHEDECWTIVKEITEDLDRLALPIDLAGARISVDADTWGDLASSLRRYLADYQTQQEQLLQDDEFAAATPYQKTTWTAWEASLSSLRQAEDSKSHLYPIQLLSFCTLFDRTNVQEELFRLASMGLQDAYDWFESSVPPWLQCLLTRKDDHEWNDSSYQATIALLLRYHLVRPVREYWKGITMHSLVQKRARHELSRGYWEWYMTFLFAACNLVEKYPRFRWYLVVHLPTGSEVFANRMSFRSEEQLALVLEAIGNIYAVEYRVEEAAHLLDEAVNVMYAVFGERDYNTLRAMSNLAGAYTNLGRLREAKDIHQKCALLRESELGPRHQDTLESKFKLAQIAYWEGRWDEAGDQYNTVLDARREVLGNDNKKTLESIISLLRVCLSQGKWDRAQDLATEGLERSKRLYGLENKVTIDCMSAMASLDCHLGRYVKAEKLQVEVMTTSKNLLGAKHTKTLLSMGELAATYCAQRRYKEAEEIYLEVLDAIKKSFGPDHRNTLNSMLNLSITYANQRRLQEAEELQVPTLEKIRAKLGEEHPYTLSAMASLASTLHAQERLVEAEELRVKVMDLRARVLGKNHPKTLEAMDDLAHTKRNLGQNAIAVDLMRQSAAASLKVLGQNHP